MKTNYGLVKTPFDARDYNYTNVKRFGDINLPSKFRLDILPVRNQGKAGTCVGFACSVIQEADGMTKKERDILSPLYLYAKCKYIDGSTNEGTDMRTAMKVLVDNGICKEQLYPYSDDENVRKLKFPTMTSTPNSDAQKRKIAGYAQIKTVKEVKEAVFNENGVLGGVLITDSFKYPQSGCVGYVNGEIYGSHAVPIIGWDDTKELSFKYREGNVEKYKGCFVIKNSWGEEWGDKGFGYIPYDVFDLEEPDEAPYRFKLVDECWTTIHTQLGNGLDDLDYHKRFNNYNPDENPSTDKKIVIEMQIDNAVAKLNGKSIRMTASPKIISGATMTPFRSPFEMLGGIVSWDGTTKTAKAEFSLENMIKRFNEIGV